MEIKAVKFRRYGFYTQPFAFGGEEGMDRFNKNVRYRGNLQNYLIDTGDEVILVDTSLPTEPRKKCRMKAASPTPARISAATWRPLPPSAASPS